MLMLLSLYIWCIGLQVVLSNWILWLNKSQLSYTTIFYGQKYTFNVKPAILWYDMWVGCYIDIKQKTVYMAIFPCLIWKIWIN